MSAIGCACSWSRWTSIGGSSTSSSVLERRGRKGRKEKQYSSAAFAAFAFQRSVERTCSYGASVNELSTERQTPPTIVHRRRYTFWPAFPPSPRAGDFPAFARLHDVAVVEFVHPSQISSESIRSFAPSVDPT